MDILTTQVTELLTQDLGRAPTGAELANGLLAPYTLARVAANLSSENTSDMVNVMAKSGIILETP